jgi:uncharacterized repeat protein (TIGR03803 family)
MARISQLFILVMLVMVIVAGVVNAQTLSVLYNFGSNSQDPYNPAYSGIVAQGQDGNLYSTAVHGGTCCGAVFQITAAGKLKNIHSFTGSGNDGAFPQGGVTLGTDGNFYGTTYEGGTATAGAVFKVAASGTYTTLYSFTGGSDGAYPYAPPVEGNDGNFYGTTTAGGNTVACGGGCGTIYKITTKGVLTLSIRHHPRLCTLRTLGLGHGRQLLWNLYVRDECQCRCRLHDHTRGQIYTAFQL